MGAHFCTCDTAKREQKAAGVLGRSVKCLNKRAIILTRSGISGVFQPFESIALLPPPSLLRLSRIFRLFPSLTAFRLSLFFSFLGPPPKMSSAWDPRKKHKTCISFAARVESLVPLYVPPIFRPVTLSGSLSLSHRISLIVAIARRCGVAFASRVCYDFQLTENSSIKIRDKCIKLLFFHCIICGN